MYLDVIFDLSNYVRKRFTEPSLKILRTNKDKYEKMCNEKYIAEDVLLKIVDKPETDPLDILNDNIDMCVIRKDKADKDKIKEMYDTYVRTLVILKQYLLKKYR